eukprot:jgi/Hompol1/1619/HPOL_005662-RA
MEDEAEADADGEDDTANEEGSHRLPRGRFWHRVRNGDTVICVCPFEGCGKSFTRPYNLKSHYRSHLGQKPFVCRSCTSSFTRKSDLKRHEKRH